jgi:hypothetical protein
MMNGYCYQTIPNQDNKCARDLLGQIPVDWGTFSTFNAIFSFTENYDAPLTYRDMDITPDQFVHYYREALTRCRADPDRNADELADLTRQGWRSELGGRRMNARLA